jgi:hypothetical protein
LQEHKWRPGKNLEMAQACARVADFELYVQPSDGPRGGAAILVRRGSQAVTDVKAPVYRMAGRYVAVPATVEGVQARIVCIYAPAESRERVVFVKKR